MPPPGGYRDAPDARRYLLFTVALLLRHNSPGDRALFAAQRDLAGRALWTRQTFARLLGALARQSVAGVVADVVYLIPGDDPAYALTPDDLKHPRFHYLRELRGEAPGGPARG